MGITVVLQDERGTRLNVAEDPRNWIASILPEPTDPSFPWAGTIDPYGDTTFNYLQAGRLLGEWRRLGESMADANALALLKLVEGFLVRASTERHLYVKFVGD